MTLEEWIKYFSTLPEEDLNSLEDSLINLNDNPQIRKHFGGDFSSLIYCIQSARRANNLKIKEVVHG